VAQAKTARTTSKSASHDKSTDGALWKCVGRDNVRWQTVP